MVLVFFTQLSFSALQFFLIFLILKTEGVDALGNYGLITSIINPIQQLFKLGVPKLISTSESSKTRQSYYTIGTIFSFSFLILGVLISFLFRDNKYFYLINLIIIYKALTSFRDVNHSVYIRQELFKNFFVSGFIFNVLIMLSFFITYKLSNSLESAFCSLVLILIIPNIIDFRFNSSNFNITTLSKKSIKTCVRLSISDVIFSIKSNMPKYLLAKYFNTFYVGVYTAIFQAVSFIEIANQSIIKYNYSKLTNIFYVSQHEFFKEIKIIYKQIFILIVLALLINIIVGKELIDLFLDPVLKEFHWLLLLLIVSRFFTMLNSIPKTTFILMKKINFNTKITFVLSLITFLILLKVESFMFFVIILTVSEFALFLLNIITIKYFYNK